MAIRFIEFKRRKRRPSGFNIVEVKDIKPEDVVQGYRWAGFGIPEPAGTTIIQWLALERN